MNKTVFLHAGRHKTGSTSVQQFLLDARQALRTHGLHVVCRDDYAALSPATAPHKAVQTNLFDLGNGVLRSGVINGLRERGIMPVLDAAARTAFADAVNRFLHSLDENDIILSAESFSFLRTAGEQADLDRMLDGFSRQVLLISRDMESWSESYLRQTRWLQRARPELLRTPGSVFDFSPTGWQADVPAMARTLRADRVRDYTTLMTRDGTVLAETLRWLGVPENAFPDVGALWENRTA